jgi:O-antigen/teichoic acid export membrane protein
MTFLVTAAAAPFTVAVPVLLGALQGQQRFGGLAALYVFQAGSRLVLATGLGESIGSLGAVVGVTLSAIATYALAYWLLRSYLRPTRRGADWNESLRYGAVIVLSGLAVVSMLSVDVIMVKYLFGGQAAGQYSVVAVLGRAIFWGAASVAAVLFPKLVWHEARGGSGLPLVMASLGLATVGGVAALVVLSTWSQVLVRLFAGAAYAGAAPYLGWYAFGMILFGAATVLIATHQSRGRAGFLWVLLPTGLVEPILIGAFHASIAQVVAGVDVSMALLLIGMTFALLARPPGRRLGLEMQRAKP